MKRELINLHIAEIIDDTPLSLGEICRNCQVNAEQIMELVDYGVVEPIEWRSSTVYFDGTSMLRARSALRLKQDLGVNLAGAALALELLDELTLLREKLKRIEE